MVLIAPEAMEDVAREMLRRPNQRNDRLTEKQQTKQWGTMFGTSSVVAADIWNRLDPVATVDRYSQPKHLLYGFLMIKVYAGDEAHSKIVGCHKNTFSKWAWTFIEAICDLHGDVVSFNNRLIGWDRAATNSGTTTDCSDNVVLEPWPFDTSMWSHEINGPALKCEVATSIFTGFIVHWNGPLKRSVADTTIFRNGLLQKLDDGECVESDSGCGGEHCLKTPGVAKSRTARFQKGKARAQQENVFARVKKFKAFSTPFVQTHDKRERCHGAVMVILQLGLEHGKVQLWDFEHTAEHFWTNSSRCIR